ncbi:MAG: hypothetical protein BRD35_01190 [Bacteroidetes bacterium QH_7_62_13]|jgi:hypothetical protein|nr:MAG: hypothetical protein BRD35_01190 [Bacteroidetes bacterium QH_7_62_13]
MSSDAPPIACNLSAIEDDDRDEHQRAAETVFEAVTDLRELDDGYAFRLPPDTDVVARAGAFVARERLCCPFFRFQLDVTPDHGPVWLRLTGRDGVKAYVEDAVLPYWSADESGPESA